MANTLKFGDGKWATGEGTALAFNDENENFKPLPFTFTRNSTATVVNESGLIEEVGNDVPRIDFKDNTKGALLLEPSRTNLVTYSEAFSNWYKSSGVVVTDNTTEVISPSGEHNASKIEFNSSNKSFYLLPTLSGVCSGYFYVKGTIGETIRIAVSGAEENFELTGEWDKIKKENITATVNKFNVNTYGGATATTIYLWGAQIEQGSYATSYIPTSGSAVTRVVDAASQTLPSSVFNSYPFSVFAEVDVVNITSGYAFSLLNKASSNQYFTIEYYSNRWHMVARPSGSTVTRSSSEVLTKGTHKLVGVYTDTNLKLFLNGSLIVSGSNTQSFNSSIDSMLLGQLRISGDTGSRNSVTQALLYNTELTDQEAITLTT